MENEKEILKDVGVIVGRFQVHELHQAHKQIIESVLAKHKKVIMFLGVTPAICTRNNPLDFVARKEMILKEYPMITVLSIPDMPSDKEWSKELDGRIREACPVNSVVLYGGRDSFLKSYFGHFETRELEQTIYVSGTEVRTEISKEVKASPDFRAGVIYAAFNQYAKVYPTVDIAIFKDDMVLLGKKPNNDKYRFLGGFTDPTDSCYEEAAQREVKEEANIEVGDLQYIGSAKIDDWRYRSEKDKIITVFFKANYLFGNIEPKDDISELKWFKLEELTEEVFVKEHIVLFNLLKKQF